MKTNRKRKALSILMSVLMLVFMVPSLSFAVGMPFTDVPGSAWYYSDVKEAYETGLINGFEDNTFRPDENMTYAQAIKLAACMNQKYSTGSVTLENGSPKWYDSYVAYAKDQNIINKNYNWNAPATRAGYVEIFANALPDEALKVKNNVADNAVPDVSMSHPQAAAIYKLYRAGVLIGNDNIGTFQPNINIQRSHVSAILTRMMNESARKELSLGPADPAEPDTPIIPDEPDTSTIDLGDPIIGEYITFGHYEQDNNPGNGKEPIEWKVLDKKDGRILVLSKYGLDEKRYDEKSADVTWETCTLRNWLNSNFLNEAFSSSEQSAIPTVTLSNPDNPNFGTEGGNDTQDKVFLLSLQEVQKYFSLPDTWTDYDGNSYDVNSYDVTGANWYIGGSKEVITSPTAYAKAQGAYTVSSLHDSEGKESCKWWLRSPGCDSRCAACVFDYGYVDAFGGFVDYDGHAVRPALWINLAS